MYPLRSVMYIWCRHYSVQKARPKVCIVGGGPAGFYCAQHLIKHCPDVLVDIYEKLPVPFGLVRYGVAPDHPEVKNVINTFTKTASSPQVRFIGNVALGRDVTLRQLQQAYHSVMLTYGAEEDKELQVAGEQLGNVIAARRFVGWYNGMPDDKGLDVDLSGEVAVVLGQGNVAIDVARVLLTSPDVLKKTDITNHSLSVLASSNIKTVHLVGRRGPLQAAFTIKELREMLRLPGVKTSFREGQMDGIEHIIPSLMRPRKRLTELLVDAAKKPPAQCDKTLSVVFFRTPVQLEGDQSSVRRVHLAVNTLHGADWQNSVAVRTKEVETLNTGLVLRSIGYRSRQADSDIPFDFSKGRALPSGPGLYSAGWLSTGPVGVILTTMTNAFDTAQLVAQDMKEGRVDISESKAGYEAIKTILNLKGTLTVSFAGWERIDRVEVERGRQSGKPREKIVDIAEMLEIGAETASKESCAC